MDSINNVMKSQYVMIIIDHATRVIDISEQSSFIKSYLPPTLKIGSLLDEIKWGETFVNPPLLGKNKIELIQTYDGRRFLVLFDSLQTVNLWIMVIVCTESNNMLNYSSIQENKDIDQNFLFFSKKMERIIDIVYKVAGVNSTILLLGESGVGKTKLARFIHKVSNRADKPFISINCGTIPETLIESELFGYEEGAFTGGKRGGRKGLFEEAHDGTIFLDEIAELPQSLQVKLLEVLQDNKIRKVGSNKSQIINVRIIAATNKDIKSLVEQKLFREDLYYRLNVVPLKIPPLRERKEEVPRLIDHFVTKFNLRYGLNISLDKELQQEFQTYHWPGNIRELENVIERIIVTNSYDWFPGVKNKAIRDKEIEINDLIPLKKAKKILEKELISRAYKKYKSTYKAAKVLEVDQSTIAKKIKLYDIQK